MKKIHAGKLGVVLGGGPSLPEHIKLIPENAVLFGVNYHASKLIDCDYIVFNDPVDYSGLKGQKVSRFRELSDIYRDSPKGLNSGVIATLFALETGCNPVILAGMDCYQGQSYFHSDEYNRGQDIPLKDQLNYWNIVPKGNVFALGGPLIEIFGKIATMKAKPATMTIKVHTAKTLRLNEDTTINFVKGEQTMPIEKAELALKAKIATK